MKKIVLKYGGSSVATTLQIKNIAQYIKELYLKGLNIVVVVSAMGKTTNNLIALAQEISISPNKRELDVLTSTGENVSTALMAMAINELGVPAISLSGAQAGFLTNEVYTRAFIKKLNLGRVKEELKNGKVVVVAGFQGISKFKNITTLGRGGSDTSAVALACGLGCPCEIYTDVEGIYTIDPRRFLSAKKLKQVSYDEMMEMAVSGAKVLEPRCVELAKKFNIPLYLGKTLQKDKLKGTVIMNCKYFENVKVTSLSVKEGISNITLTLKNGTDINEVVEILHNNALNLDMVTNIYFGTHTLFSFNVPSEVEKEIVEILSQKECLRLAKIKVKNNLSKLTLIGAGMLTHTEIANRLLNVLSKNQIKVYNISTSQIAIALLVDEKNQQKAVDIIAPEFEL